MRIQDLSFLDVFEHYDPLHDALPDELHWKIGHVQQGARRILKGRTVDQLERALKLLVRWRVFAESNSIFILEQIYPEEDQYSFSTNQAMYFAAGDFDFTEDNPDRFNPAELFATLALAKIGAVVVSDQETSEDAAAVQSVLFEAVEAVWAAEALWIDVVRNRKRSETQRANAGKHYGPVKRWVATEFPNLEKGISLRKAARILAAQMPEDLRNRFATEDIDLTVNQWLIQYKKGQLSDVDDLPPFPD